MMGNSIIANHRGFDLKMQLAEVLKGGGMRKI